MALPIAKPLRRGGFIAGSKGERHWVSFKYERLPMFCHFCGILGHDLKHYAAHYAMEKNGGSMEYQYGDFLKAVGGCARVVASQHTSPKSNLEEGIGNDSINTLDPTVADLLKTAAVTEVGRENPKSVDVDDSVIPGEEILRMDNVNFI